MSCLLLLQYLTCSQKIKQQQVINNCIRKLHYCFPIPIVLQDLGDRTPWQGLSARSSVHKYQGGRSQHYGNMSHSLLHSYRSQTYLLYWSVPNSVGIVIVINDVQICHCLSRHRAAELHIQRRFSSSFGEHGEVRWLAIFHT